MIKKLLITLLFVFTVLHISSLEVKAMDGYDNPISYYSIGGGNHYLYSTFYFAIPIAPTYFELYIPRTNYNVDSIDLGGGIIYKSTITLLKANRISGETLNIEDYAIYREDYGSYIFPQATLDLISLNNYVFFEIKLLQTYDNNADFEYLQWFNDRFNFSFNVEIATAGPNTIQYFVGTKLYYLNRYSFIPDRPVDPKYPNLWFDGWLDINGDPYNFDVELLATEGTNDLATLTASWRLNRPDDIDPIVDSTPDILAPFLNVIGCNNTIGKIIIYFIVMLAITLTLIAIKLNAFIIILINTLIFGVFIFMGWIPIYMTIVLGLVFITGLVKSLKDGV